MIDSSVTKNHVIALDGIRGMAALAIVLSHIGIFMPWTPFPKGDYAVDLFFCLSGFVLSLAYQKHIWAGMHFFEFMKIRICRLYPMQILGLLFGVAVMMWLYHSGETDFTDRKTLKALALNALYIPNLANEHDVRIGGHIFNQSFTLNGPQWSLTFEMILSLAFFFLCRLEWGGLKRAWIISGILMVLFANRHSGPHNLTFYWGTFRSFYPFITGMVLYKRGNVIRERFPNIGFGLISLLVIFPYCIVDNEGEQAFYLLYVFTLSPLAIALGAFSTKINKPAMLAIAKYIGLLSYPIYCLHWPVLLFFIGFSGPEIHSHKTLLTMKMAIMIFAVSMMLAHVCAKYVDLPLRHKFGKLLGLRRDPLR